MSTQHPRLVISGVGLISPLGSSAWSTFRALLAGQTICQRAAGLPSAVDPVRLVRRVGECALAQHGCADPAIDLAERASREACFEAGADPRGIDAVVGSSKGAVCALADVLAQFHRGHRGRVGAASGAPMVVAMGPHAFLSQRLRNRLGLRTARHVVSACSSGLAALHLASQTLRGLDADRRPQKILVVSAEAALLPLFIHSYHRLGVLCPLRPDAYCARPLAASRDGFVLSQLAAAVVVRRVESVVPGQIELVDTAMANEACDLVRPASRMEALDHVARRLMINCRVDVLHPHAPGTVDHDEVELSVLGRCAPAGCQVYASKGALGHGLGAAGLVSLVVACLCARTGRRPPMPWLRSPMPAPPALSPALRAQPAQTLQPLRTHAVFAAGFGGHVAGAVVRAV